MTQCATLGCSEEAKEVLVWRDENRTREPVCLDCAQSYSRRATYGRTYYIESGRK